MVAYSCFRSAHPRTQEIYDIKHKAACVLKGRLHQDRTLARVPASSRPNARTPCGRRNGVFRRRPAPKDKARFMNLQPQLAWAEGVLDILRAPPRSGVQLGERRTLAGEVRLAA